jgi:hypothetical protein
MLKKTKIAAALSVVLSMGAAPAAQTFVQIPVVYAAEGSVVIEGLPASAETLTAAHEFDGEVTYQWQVATGGGGAFFDIEGANAKMLDVKNAYAALSVGWSKAINTGNALSRRVRVKVTDGDGIEHISSEVSMEKALGPVIRIENAAGATYLQLVARQEKTPDKFTFKLADGSENEFILLDDMGGDGYFVLAKDFYGKHGFDVDFGSQKFDPDRTENIAYWLNNDFLENGNGGKTLPDGIKNNIVPNHRWKTESGSSESAIPDDYYVNAGVVLLSQQELMEYCSKIGILDELSWSAEADGWALRTVRGFDGKNVNKNFNEYLYVSTARQYHTMPTDSLAHERYVRPAFYLNKDFFKNVKIDISGYVDGSVAENDVIDELKSIGRAELDGLYNQEELLALFGEESFTPASVSGAYINYDFCEIGENLTAEYDFVPAAEVAPDDILGNTDNSTVQWQQSADKVNWTNIASGKNFKVTKNQAEKYIRAVVTPKDGRQGAPEGTPAETESIGRFPKNLGPINRVEGSGLNTGSNESTPEENVFVIGDKSYILLDNKGEEGFFVLTKDYYGQKAFSTQSAASANIRFNPSEETSVAYWMNSTDGLLGSGEYALDKAVSDHIIEKRWTTEGGFPGTDMENDYTVAAKAVLLSQTELYQYRAKIGMLDLPAWGEDAGWYTRSFRGTIKDQAYQPLVVAHAATNKYQTLPVAYGTEALIRPAFYLDKDFFSQVKVDVKRTGENVMQIIRETGSDLYSPSELYGNDLIDVVDCTITDADGYEIDEMSLQDYDEIRADLYVNPKYSGIGMNVVFAVYGEDGKLIKLNTGNVDKADVAANELINVKVPLQGLLDGGKSNVSFAKVYIWDNLGGMTPFVGALEFFRN